MTVMTHETKSRTPSSASPILVTARNERNLELLDQFLRTAEHHTVSATSLTDVDRLLDEETQVSLAVLDADGFSADLWERCERLQANGTPVLVLSLRREAVERPGLKHGARTVLEKPVRKEELLELIEALLAAP